MNISPETIPETLSKTIQEFDTVFSEDRGNEMGSFFAENARVQWPWREDIVGREEIRSAFKRLVKRYTTLAWKPDRSLGLVCDGKAVTIGRFIEERCRKDTGITERVFGRIVEIWSETQDGKWMLELLMTSRYADTETIQEN